MHNTREEAKIKPIKFSRDLAPLDGEVFKNVKAPELKGIYKISNYCRIKRLKHHHKGREHREMILTPFRNLKNDNAKFRLIIRDVSYNVQDLMYDAFKGLPLGKVAMPKDGDNRNLCMDNMKAVNSTWSHIEKHIKEKTAKTQSTPKEITVNLNTGDKAEKLLEIKSLKLNSYSLASENEGVYVFKLIPKEGDLVKITIEGATIPAPNEYKVKTKDGLKYYLDGVDPINYFFASELELIKLKTKNNGDRKQNLF